MCWKKSKVEDHLSLSSTEGFTAGKVYQAVERVPGGVVVIDKHGKAQVLPEDYVKSDFRKI